MTGARLLPRLARLRVLMCLAVVVGGFSIVPAAQAAATFTVCPHFCSYTSIQAAVNAANSGDTVEVMVSGSPYTEQVTVAKQITLEGAGSPVLKLEPSSASMPTLHFTTAASGSTLENMDVQSDGSATNDAVDFDQAAGTITDVSATATGRGLFVDASGVKVGPKVSATSSGNGESALVVSGSVTVTGVTAAANVANNGTGGDFSGGATVTDSTFTGSTAALALSGGATARRVVATGYYGISANDALVADSLAIGADAVVATGGTFGPLQLRNVTAIGNTLGLLAQASPGAGGAIVAKNVIARGGSTDVLADMGGFCGPPSCGLGSVQIGYSNFRTTSSSGVDTATIGHNQSGDPQFVDGTVGPSQDFHLKGTSPAIGAGVTDPQTGMTDLEGKPRPVAGQSEPSIGAYEPAVHALTVSVSGNGSVSTPGIGCPGACSNSYPDGSTVTLTAAPTAGSQFAGWSGACSGAGPCQVTMTADRSVAASFTPLPPPALSHVRLGSSAFLAKKGTTLKLTLSETATVNVRITETRHGRKVKGRCKQNAKHGRRCALTVQKATRTFGGASGSNRFTLLIPKLAPGRYQATVTARTASKNSTPVKLSFTIKKPKKK